MTFVGRKFFSTGATFHFSYFKQYGSDTNLSMRDLVTDLLRELVTSPLRNKGLITPYFKSKLPVFLPFK